MTTTTEVEGLLVGLEPLAAAANEEFIALPQPSGSGWDPYEMWRARIKAAQDEQETGPGSI